MIRALALISALLLSAPALAHDSVDLKGLMPKSDGEQKLVFTNRAAWETFWVMNGTGPAPEVDFSKHDLALYIMGMRPTGGYTITLAPAEGKRKDARGMTVENCMPPEGFMVTQSLSKPAAALLISKSDQEMDWILVPCKRVP